MCRLGQRLRQYDGMRILGLIFAGTSTPHRSEMANFLSDTLLLPRVQVDGVEAELFGLPDGSTFAVASPGGMDRRPGRLASWLTISRLPRPACVKPALRSARSEITSASGTCTFVLRTVSSTNW